MPRKPNTPENKIHHCSFCDKSFRYDYELKAHTVIHTDEKNFICPDCDKRFLRAGNLKRHLLVHSDVKNFSCSDCNKAFKAADALKKHRREVHEQIKPFKCTICNKAFARTTHLKEHMITHSGIKNHKCSRCGLLFTQLSGLNKHKKNICNADGVIIVNTYTTPDGEVATSTTHTMAMSSQLVTVVSRSPNATVTKQKHLGATVTTVLPERATVSERQGPHTTTDLPLAAINDMTQGQQVDPLEGDLSDLPNINPTTSILFDAGDIGGIDDMDFGLDYNLPGILEFSD